MRFILALLAFSLLAACGPDRPAADGLIIRESAHSVDETLDRLEDSVEALGGTVFARIDHARGADSIGETMGDTELLIFGNPSLGTPLIQRQRTAAIDLPVRVLAWRENGETWLAYTDPAEIARRHGLNAEGEAVRRMRTALESLVAAAVSEEE